MIFDEVLKDISEKRERKVKGLYNGIPFPFERYKDFVPSIDKGMYYGILGSSGIGKSKFMRHTFIYETFKFAMGNDYPLKILLFALEDPKKSVYKKMMCHYLWERFSIDISTYTLDSKYKELDPRHLALIKDDREFYRKFEETVYIVNSASTPSEIFDVCSKAHDKFGKTHHIIAIIDNYSNVTCDPTHQTEWHAIRDLSRRYVRLQLCKEMDMTVVAVLQTDMESEKNTFRTAGKASIASLEPNVGSIAEAKTIVRDMFVLFGLFNPWRYEITKYPFSDGYDIGILRNRFRALTLLKSNEGEMAPRLGLYFDGKKEVFAEMPKLEEKERLEKLYQDVLKEEKERKEKAARGILF